MKRLSLMLIMLFLGITLVTGQTLIKGSVIDETDSAPLVGASVVAKGTTAGTVTDVDGSFSLEVPKDVQSIVISFVGYVAKEVAIGNTTQFSIKLERDAEVLGDVVVVGYGTQTKKELTGSVSKVSGDVISRLPVAGVDQALQGQAAGVQVTTNSGTPGGGVSIRVRGPSSITAGNQPLYVIDGIPINTGNYAQLGVGGQGTNALADLNPTDIASIEVLKDAAAASIYGSRASNGVVLITTKRGKSGRSKISLNSYYGTQEAWRRIEPQTGQEHIGTINESRRNVGLAPLYSATDSTNAANTNWQSEILQTAPMSNTDLSFEGGTERLQYRVSGSYFNQQGIIRGSAFDRISVRANVDNRLTDKLKLSFSSSYSRSLSNRINNDNNIYGVLSAAFLVGGHIPVRNADGTYARDPLSSVENPLLSALEPTFEAPTQRTLANASLEYEITNGLTLRSNVGADIINYREFRFTPSFAAAAAGVRGQAFETFFNDVNLINENLLFYKKNFGKFKTDLVLGLSFQKDRSESLFAQGENFPGNTIKTLNASSVKRDIQSNRDLWGINSQFARVNFSYDGRYILSGSVRRDGSSRFGADQRYGVFPGLSAAWVISEEGFLKNNKTISFLKLKGGWGLRGNSNIANLASRALISAGANYNQIAGLTPTQLGNLDLTWEEREDITAGIEVGLLRDRISLEVEAYRAKTNQLLLNRPLVFTSGYAGINQNVGGMENNGLDFRVAARIVENKNFSWSLSVNASTYKNKITDLVNEFAAGFASWVDTGYALGAFRGYRVEKIFQTQDEINALNTAAREKTKVPTAVYQSTATRPGDIMFVDLNGDGVITSADQEVIGDANPSWFGGITNDFNIFGVDISFFFQYNIGNEIYNNTRGFSEGMNGVFGQFASVRNRWTPTNTGTDIPRAAWGDPNNNRRTSTRFLEDGSYARLKNLTIGYSIPKSITSKLRLSNLRIYYSGQNLLTFTNYKGLDPEISTFGETNTAPGTDFLTFPQARVNTFGINVSF
jgi:TonB-dependent starch-binding outer membrane protein SusC